ncbi:glutathione S-transferase family protein [Oceanibacterium hippocampi]|uniref:Glutathione S-transferase n=1 Tax=Oceanibacterium hippocampi TaxID=745714 RepID=A0A1Y5TQ61_9PROT|nr:glutathione S-transferase family protein [Oceanibacterium hippocampi]SLN69394.1 Glutathione S-transferase [Oceanibacterium hippocampi]
MYTLHYYPGNASLTPHILLEEIGAPYELALVDRQKNAQKSAEYLKLNPSGRIPVLIDGDLVLFETAAISLHLADRHPEAKLAPELGSAERAHFYKWLMYLTNTIQTEVLTFYYPERWSESEAGRAEINAHAGERLGQMFDLLENAFAEHGGDYFLGDRFSALDPYLLMVSRWSRKIARPAITRPRLGAFVERLSARPSVIRAFEAEGIAPPYC